MLLQCGLIFMFVLDNCLAASSLVYKEDVNVTLNRQWVNLGGLFPLSWNQNGECGVLSTTAVEQVEAMVFAIKRINEDPFLLPGVNLTFDIRDTCAIPSRALQLALDYIHSSGIGNQEFVAVSGVLGSAFTDSSILVANILGLFEIPQISYEATGAILSDKTRYNYFFRTIPSDILQVRAIASLIHRFNWTYIFVFYSEDTYGEDGVMSLIEELQANSSTVTVCLAVQMGLPVTAPKDDPAFDLAVEQMNMEWVRNASVAVLFGHNDQANGLFSAVRRKLEADPDSPLRGITWIGSDSWGTNFDPNFYRLARGMFAIRPMSAAVSEFIDYFVGLRPNTTSNPWFDSYWESVFNCSLGFNSGDNPCRLEEQKLERNQTLNSQHPNIIRGVYAIAKALNTMISYYCPNNILCDRVIISRISSEVVNGELLRKYLLNTSLSDINHFDGDEQLFDKNGDVTSSYAIFNLQIDSSSTFKFRPVGSWDHVNLLNISVSDIKWRSGRKLPQSVCSLPCGPGQEPVSVPNQAQCCWTCKGCLGDFSVSSGDRCYECEDTFIPNSDKSNCTAVPISYFTWSSPLGIVTAILASLGIVVCIGTGIMFVVFISNSVIKASSRELSAILLCGILLCYIIPLIYLVKPSPTSCAIQRLVSGLCFAIVYSALLVKTNRIHRIFNRSKNGSVSPHFVSPASQVIFTLLLSLIQLIIASIWLAAEPPRVKTVLVNRRLLELVCDHNPHATLVVTVVYNLILLITSAFFAFRTRKVPELFNEAKFISVTIFSLCVVWLAFVPTFYISTTVEGGSEFQIFSLSLTIMLSASTTLCCLLMPKPLLVMVMKIKDKQINTAKSLPSSTELTSKWLE